MPLILEASVEPGFLDGSVQVSWTDEMYDYGELPSKELVELYENTMEKVVFKGLEAVGVDTSRGRAWLAKQTSKPS